ANVDRVGRAVRAGGHTSSRTDRPGEWQGANEALRARKRGALLAARAPRLGWEGAVGGGNRRDLPRHAQRQQLLEAARPERPEGREVVELLAVAGRDGAREEHADAQRGEDAPGPQRDVQGA